MESIRASEKALGDVFCDKYVFHIPPYQRPYSWGSEQVEELLDDLLWATGENAPSERPPYFLGSIVLIKRPESPVADVVDGQQRLTTMTILVSVLKELATNEEEKANIDVFLRQRGNPNLGTKDVPRLTVRPRDADFFRKTIQEGGDGDLADAETTDARKRMLQNRDYLRTRLMAMATEQRARILPFAAQRCYLVVVEASDQASAYRIFSVMNDRGMDLSPTDILKADIIGAIPDEFAKAKYTEVWETLEDDLGREAFKDLFAHIRMIHRKQKMRGTLEREFNEFVSPRSRPIEFIDEELRPSAVAFKDVLFPDPWEMKRYKLLRGLSHIDNQDWQPAAIKCLVKFHGDAAAADAFLAKLERLAYYLFMVRANINERLNRYGQVLQELENGVEPDKSPAIDLLEDEAWALFEVLDGPIYENARTRKPILLKLDETLSDGSAHYEQELITIEHVLPQTPPTDSEWIVDFPDPEFREDWVHSLANLVLLSRYKNPAASNYDFEYKKTKYFSEDGDSPFLLTNQVRETVKWTPKVLEKRQYELIGKLARHWNLGAEFTAYMES